MTAGTPFKREGGLWVPTTRAERQEQQRLARYATLTCGMYAWVPGETHPCDQAGSGVLIAPGLVLTAKHVVDGMATLDARWDPTGPKTQNLNRPQFDIRIYQAPRFGQDVLWYTTDVWKSKDTDIALLRVRPESEMARWAMGSGALAQAFVPWRLAPPPVGERVELYGWPKPGVVNDGGPHTGPVQWVQQEGTVTDVFEPYRTHGHLDFPCFRIDRPVDGGFSGGPVFYKGALVGITSISLDTGDATDIERDAYVASLWPLLLFDVEVDGRRFTFQDRFDYGTIPTVDAPSFRGKVYREPCDLCSMNDSKHLGHANRKP